MDINSLWWEGVRLWYNERDYASAMRSWRSACAAKDSDVGPLMVFLAGCLLDAGEYSSAREIIKNYLDDLQDFSGELATMAIKDLMASYEEDPSVTESWKESYQVVKSAIQKGSNYWTNPYQRAGFICSSISQHQKPYYQAEELPAWCLSLEKSYTEIRVEFDQLCGRSTPSHWPQVGSGVHRDGAGQHDGSVVENGGDWREVVLFGSGARPELAPKTAQRIQRYAPEAVELAAMGGGEVIFSVLAPGTRIKPHCGGHDLRLTAHLGLVVPAKNCFLRVSEKQLTWKEGKILVFDDSFEHEVVNDSDELRGVLLLRFWHPLLKKVDRDRLLSQVVEAKKDDTRRRCNPPLPEENTAVHQRAMEESTCSACGETGYLSLTVVRGGVFRCICGMPIN